MATPPERAADDVFAYAAAVGMHTLELAHHTQSPFSVCEEGERVPPSAAERVAPRRSNRHSRQLMRFAHGSEAAWGGGNSISASPPRCEPPLSLTSALIAGLAGSLVCATQLPSSTLIPFG